MVTILPDDVILGCNGVTEAVVSSTGGTVTLQYKLQDSTSQVLYDYQTSPKFTITQTGIYIVSVRDANGCQNGGTINVINAPTLTLTATTNTANNNYCLQGGVKGKVEVQVRTSKKTEKIF